MALQIKDFLTSANLDQARDVFVKDGYAYVTSPTQDTLTILDISDPTNISIKGQLTDNTNLNLASSVYVDGNYAYITNAVNIAGINRLRVALVDISDKTAPSFIANTDWFVSSGGSSKIKKHNDLLYFTNKASKSIYFFTTKGKKTLSPLRIFTTSFTMTGTRISEICKDDEGVVYGTTGSSNGIVSLNLKNYFDDFITEISNEVSTFSAQYDVLLDGDYLYCLTMAYFYVIDISDFENPTVVGSINSSTYFSWGVGGQMVKSGDYIFATISRGDTVSIDISNKTSPTVVDSDAFAGSALTLDGNYLYVSGSNRFKIYDVSDPTNIVGKTLLTLSGFSNFGGDIVIDGNYAYILEQTYQKCLYVVDISDKDAPSEVTRLDSLTYFNGRVNHSMIKYGNYLYIASSNYLTTVDISTPSSPSIYNYTSLSGGRLYRDGTTLYSLGIYFYKLDISDIDAITIDAVFSNYNNLTRYYNTSNEGDVLIAVSSYRSRATISMTKFDLSRFTEDYRTALDEVTGLNNPLGIEVDNLGNLFVAEFDGNKISVFDVSDPTNITLVDYLTDGTKLNGVYDLYYISGYLIATAQVGDYVTVVSTATMTVVDSITDATELNGAKRLYRNLTELYVACYDGDGLAVLDISGLLPVEFTPKVILI